MLGEVFLLGHWKDYDELESSLSMPELTATLKAMYESERRRQKFMAALQGVDIDAEIDKTMDEKVSTLDDVKARAAARLTGDKNLAGAIQQGITADMGTQYYIAEGDSIG